MHLWTAEEKPPRGSRVACFDFDDTCAPDSAHRKLVEHMVGQGLLPDLHDFDEVLQSSLRAFQRREQPRSVYDGHWVRVLNSTYVAARFTRAMLHEKARTFVSELLSDRFAFTTALFEALRDEGYALVMISHGPHELMHAIAKAFGFHHAIGNVMEVDADGVFTGVDGRVPVKHQDLRDIVDRFGYTMEGSIAIGDSVSDLGMLMAATHGIAFNPEPGLIRALAQAPRGMNIVRVTEVGHAIQITRPVRSFTAQARLVYEYRIEEVFPPLIAAAVRKQLEARGYHLF